MSGIDVDTARLRQRWGRFLWGSIGAAVVMLGALGASLIPVPSEKPALAVKMWDSASGEDGSGDVFVILASEESPYGYSPSCSGAELYLFNNVVQPCSLMMSGPTTIVRDPTPADPSPPPVTWDPQDGQYLMVYQGGGFEIYRIGN